MYHLMIPIYNRKYDEETKLQYLELLKNEKPCRILVVYDRILCDDKLFEENHSCFTENIEFFKSNGFEVGAWLVPTIGYGSNFYGDKNAPYLKNHCTGGYDVNAFCPLDDGFVKEFCKVIKSICSAGIDFILFEDDYTLSGGKSFEFGCCCERHMQELCKMVNEDVTVAELREYIYGRQKNKYRSAFLELQGKTLIEFTAKIEKEIHKDYPHVRMGLSANSSSFDIEGVEINKLAKILAGNNRPFMRLTGAPYWKNAVTLAPNIEAVRLQEHWCGESIECYTEGDTYPRPRFTVPSAMLECYDMILRAAGGSEGILKYMVDYNSKPNYEKGYVIRHQLNKPHYEEIERRFGNKTPVGLNVFENTLLFENREFRDGLNPEDFGVVGQRGFLPVISQWFIADNSIPTVYGGKDCASIVFGENGKRVNKEILKNGVILDAQAARYLMKQGIDVGIRDIQPAQKPMGEYFMEYSDQTLVTTDAQGTFYKFSLDENARVLSEFLPSKAGLGVLPPNTQQNPNKYPACYLYENTNKERFMVYSFIPETVRTYSHWCTGFFRNYYRQRQLASGIEFLQRRRLPAVCFDAPDLYVLCKKDDNSMSVGIWNIFADSVENPVLHLDFKYDSVDIYNNEGTLFEDKVILKNPIPAYGFVFLTVYKK